MPWDFVGVKGIKTASPLASLRTSATVALIFVVDEGVVEGAAAARGGGTALDGIESHVGGSSLRLRAANGDDVGGDRDGECDGECDGERDSECWVECRDD